jgi:hypothetical protein
MEKLSDSKRYKVFGIGLNKTGTKTLQYCFKEFGYSYKSHDLDMLTAYRDRNWSHIFNTIDKFDSFEDWPYPLIYKELAQKYPGAKFILTTRINEDIWFESLKKHSHRTGPTEQRKIAYGYQMPEENEAHHKSIYTNHNKEVREFFSGNPFRFLEVCWENGDGWEKICKFLDQPVPSKPFPHENKTKR